MANKPFKTLNFGGEDTYYPQVSWSNITNKPEVTDGKSAYELALDGGFEGTEEEWIASLKGDKGDTGSAGSNGTSVTVTNVSESAADGGSNVITFSDGKTVTVKNGSKGSKGDKGDTGATGPAYTLTSTDKTSIAAAVKASLTTENWTFTLSSGSTVTKAVYIG